MTLTPTPVIVRIPLEGVSHLTLSKWVSDNIPVDRVTYFFPYREFTFADQADATAFMLKFNGHIKSIDNSAQWRKV